jgi:hypothetical protein
MADCGADQVEKNRCSVDIKGPPGIRINDAAGSQLARGLITDNCNAQIVSPAAVNLAGREMSAI